MSRVQVFFLTFVVVFYVGNVIGVTWLANTRHTAIVMDYAIGLGVFGIFVGLGLIVFLFTRPPLRETFVGRGLLGVWDRLGS